jgi:hypothetical protein
MSESDEASPATQAGEHPALSLDGVSEVEAQTLLLDTVRTHLSDILRGIAGS